MSFDPHTLECFFFLFNSAVVWFMSYIYLQWTSWTRLSHARLTNFLRPNGHQEFINERTIHFVRDVYAKIDHLDRQRRFCHWNIIHCWRMIRSRDRGWELRFEKSLKLDGDGGVVRPGLIVGRENRFWIRNLIINYVYINLLLICMWQIFYY